MNPIISRPRWSIPFIALLAAGPSAAQGAPAAGRTLIVAHPPAPETAWERLRIEVVAEGSATSATGARAASELVAQRVVRALAASGVAATDLRVAGTTLLAEYARESPLRTHTIRETPRPIGYRALTAITVHTDEAHRVGLLLDLAHGAGATPLHAFVSGETGGGVRR